MFRYSTLLFRLQAVQTYGHIILTLNVLRFIAYCLMAHYSLRINILRVYQNNTMPRKPKLFPEYIKT